MIYGNITRKKPKSNRKRLILLFKRQQGKCCYCGCQTILPKKGYRGKHSENTSTIEHIYSNFDLRRLFLLGRFEKIKMSCLKCNHARGREEEIKIFENYPSRKYKKLLINLLKQPENDNPINRLIPNHCRHNQPPQTKKDKAY
jgi:hypothetical protein